MTTNRYNDLVAGLHHYVLDNKLIARMDSQLNSSVVHRVNKINTEINTNPQQWEYIKKDQTNMSRQKERFFFPNETDQLFWMFFIFLKGNDKYELTDTNKFLIEKEEKMGCIDEIRKNKRQLSGYKIKGIKDTVEDDLVNSKKIDIKSDKVDLKTLIARQDKYGEYAWTVISKIIKYASSLVPSITKEFNDIDEAMRLGFNWAKGPFEMLEEIGVKFFFNKIDEFKGNEFLENLSKTKNENFYGERQKYTEIETLGKIKKKAISLDGNNSAQIYRFNDYNIVEFTTKANALDYDSMDALKKATDKPLIIINESMQFSAGVNLTYTMNFADKGDFKSIEKFIRYFQETCKTLKYSRFPVISAPSGLTLGGGFEVLVQSNFVASHTNIVIGLVETIVGLIPAGGGCKEMLARWLNTDEAKKDPNFAPLKVFNIIGYGKTATSPIEAVPLKYLMPEDKKIMNRNSLLDVSKEILNKNRDFKAPDELVFKLPGESVREEMYKILDKLYNDKVILDHGMEVARELAFVLSGGDTSVDKTITEDQLFQLELNSFMKLIETKKTQQRIKHTLATGKPLVN